MTKRTLRMKELAEYVGLAESTLWERIKEDSKYYDPDFPKKIRLGSGSVGWDSEEVDRWLKNRAAQPKEGAMPKKVRVAGKSRAAAAAKNTPHTGAQQLKQHLDSKQVSESIASKEPAKSLIQIALPSGEAIHCGELLRIIAKATYPTLETARGIDCIVEKLVTRAHVAPDFETPFKLTEQDRLDIAPLLSDLPEMHGQMTELEVNQFNNAYALLPNRLDWRPYIVNPVFIANRKAQQWDCQAEHMAILQKKLLDKVIDIFDEAHRPCQVVQANFYMSREAAIAYVKSCGIKVLM